MNNSTTLNNAWFKLAVVSLVGIILIFVVLWGINQFNRNFYGYGNNFGNGYQMSNMPMNGAQMNNVNGMPMNGAQMNNGNGIPMNNGMNIQGNMQMDGMPMDMNMQGSMQMNGMPMDMNMNMQGGMNMMGRMGMH